VHASVFAGIGPSYFHRKYGVQKSMIFGGLMLTGAHLIGLMMLNSENRGDSFATLLLFIMGVIGG